MTNIVYACDIGSTIQGRFAWKRTGPPVAVRDGEESSIEELVDRLKQDLKEGCSIALGFEAPLFIPIPKVASQLSRGRTGDSTRSCFAPAGASVATLGLHQAASILKQIRVDSVGLRSPKMAEIRTDKHGLGGIRERIRKADLRLAPR